MNNQKLIALDFDGTMIDSLEEVLLVTFCYLTGKRTLDLAEIDPRFVAHFKANRFHVQPAGDFTILGSFFLTQFSSENINLSSPQNHSINILSREAYSRLLDNPSDLGRRTEQFFAVRNEIANIDRTAWAKMSRPYLPLWETLQENLENFVVLTNKNKQAVLDISKYWNINLDSSRIYSGDGGVSKTRNLSSIRKNFPGQNILFIDDSISNLLEVQINLQELLQDRISERNESGGNIELFLATWGYVGPEDLTLADSANIPAITQNELIAIFYTECNNNIARQPTRKCTRYSNARMALPESE